MKYYSYFTMGEDGVLQKLGNMKAFLGIVAGAGASYGLYKMLLRACREDPERKKIKAKESGKIQPGSLMDKVSGFNVVSGNMSTEVASGKPKYCMTPHTVISSTGSQPWTWRTSCCSSLCSPGPGPGTSTLYNIAIIILLSQVLARKVQSSNNE